MDARELAQLLDGMEYPPRIAADLLGQAKAAGLVIVTGCSDDLIEFDGAFRDEAGCSGGGTVRVNRHGVAQNFADIDHEDEDALRDYFAHEKDGAEITALWCEEPGYAWTYQTAIPHATFEVMEGGGHYCRGIVFALADLPS